MKRIFFFSIAMMTCFFSVQAQQDSVKLNQKIDQLFTIMNMADAISTDANTSAEQTITNAPALASHKDEAKSFFNKYIGWPGFKNELIKIYARFYSTSEIDELIKFYQTPAGKKTLANNLQLQQEIVNKQTEKLQAHVDELNKLANPT